MVAAAAAGTMALGVAGPAQAFTWSTQYGTVTAQMYSGAVPSSATEYGESIEYQAPCDIAPYCPATLDEEQDLWLSAGGVQAFSYDESGAPLPYHRLALGYQSPEGFSYSFN